MLKTGNEGDELGVMCANFNEAGTRFAGGDTNGVVHVWSTMPPVLLATLRGHRKDVTSVQFSHHDDRIASGYADDDGGVDVVLTPC